MVDIAGIIAGAVTWLLVIVLVGAAVLFFVGQLKYRYKVRVRKIVNGRKVIRDDVGALVKDKDGTPVFHLRKHRMFVSVPPAGAEDVDRKGKPILECWMTENGEIQWMIDNIDIKEVAPLTSNHRQFVVNQMRKAEALRKKSWLDNIGIITNAAALVIIVVCLLVFWGDMGEPLLEMGDKINTNQALQNEYLSLQGQLNVCQERVQKFDVTTPNVPDTAFDIGTDDGDRT